MNNIKSYILETNTHFLNVVEYSCSVSFLSQDNKTKEVDNISFNNASECWEHLKSIGYSKDEFSKAPF
jgi:hypothetical protein